MSTGIALLLTAVPLWAQTEIRQLIPFEGEPCTAIPEDPPPVANCVEQPIIFGPCYGTEAVAFDGTSFVGFHEQIGDVDGNNETFSIQIDQTLESGTSYRYRFMARIAPIDPTVNPPWEQNNGGRNSGSFDVYAGSGPCAQDQLLGTVSLEWPVDDAWTEHAFQFVANADHQYFTYVTADTVDEVPVGSTTHYGIDDAEPHVPGIAIDKTGDGPDPLSVGDTIEYSFLVTNTGTVTLADIAITDPLPGMSPIDCPDDTLAPGAEMTCTSTYTVTQEDADTGFVENTATVTGSPPDGPPVTAEDGSVVPPSQKPGISVEKSGSGPDPLEVGGTVEYSFLVANTGNVTLSGITVDDPLDGLSPIDCPDDTLTPGAEMTCTATYTVTQEDVDAGTIENTATATGQPPGDLPPPTDEDTATFPPDQTPGISIEKSGSGPEPLTVGSTVEYEFLVTNTGNVTLTEVTVEDPLDGLSPVDCPADTLAPGAEMTCTATYEVTQADVDTGVIENTATVTGQTPGGGPPPTDESTTTFPPEEPVPALPPLAFVLLLTLLATATLWVLRRARV